MIYIILGMHKSGTTAVASILSENGINFITTDENNDYDKGNKYESDDIKKINLKILRSADEKSYILNLKNKDKYPNFLNATKIIKKYNSIHKDWGFKDPRTVLTYDMWKSILPVHKIICVFRSPVQVYNHYIPNFEHFIKHPYKSFMVLKQYYIYNRLLLEYIKNFKSDRYILLEYPFFIDHNLQISKLSVFMGKDLIKSKSLNKKLYRSKENKRFDFVLINVILKLFFNKNVYCIYNKLTILNDEK